ncbi:hypothetical protein [Mucilaginibacter sp. OK283]|jgi:hypothetical protein|uniref:AbiTii domain-containing protein n=1 Tax=Mucilaginibacter sp. OK283 TaxID=1881049 RepID=UPI0008C0A88C|nr:hypothetical protein [Mucilaginibacter sp. OK283]SEO44701.1 hypothetical protein SAMN05428947_102396 [Mucilaginibacter sp. OK283]
MIKSLINDIVYDKITLSQALTRAKLIAFKIDNETLKQWVKKELEGYIHEDPHLPVYRRIRCTVKATLSDPYGMYKQTVPVSFGKWKELDDIVSVYEATQGIASIENNIISITGDKGIVELTTDQVLLLSELLEKQITSNKTVISARQEIGRIQLSNIIDLTKQKLIDTLLELNKEFPDLNDDFKMTDDATKKIENIVTNNIYGNNNPLNVATGYSIEQKKFTFNTTTNFNELEKFGVNPDEIKELETIVSDNKGNSEAFKSKIFKWLGGVSSAVAGRGLYEHIPAITDFVHTHLIK